MPLSSSFVCAMAPWRFACDELSWAMRRFWSAIFCARARCWAWASASSSAWAGPGDATGAAIMPTRNGTARRAMRRRDRRSVRDRGKRWVVAWRVNEQASSSRASVSRLALRREATERGTDSRPLELAPPQRHSRDDRFPASGQCTSVGNGLPVRGPSARRTRRRRPPDPQPQSGRPSCRLAAPPGRLAPPRAAPGPAPRGPAPRSAARHAARPIAPPRPAARSSTPVMVSAVGPASRAVRQAPERGGGHPLGHALAQ